LGYDNRSVAVKSWALLFAVRDFAGRIENPPRPPEPKPTWSRLFQQIADTEDSKKRLAAWRARSLVVGKDAPASGAASEYEDGSPEKALAEFLELWRRRNYGEMANYVSELDFYFTKENVRPRRVREVFGDKVFGSFRLAQIRDEAPAITEIDTLLQYSVDHRTLNHNFTFRLLHEDSTGDATPRGKPGSAWRLIWWEVREPVSDFPEPQSDKAVNHD
jgi:hypothetical protein